MPGDKRFHDPKGRGMAPHKRDTPPLVRLKAVCGPGDHGEPVVTVMLPDEGASCHDAD